MAQISIKSPITTDGISLDLKNGQVQYREDLADARAKRDFEKQNEKLPNHLKMIIVDVPDNYIPGQLQEVKQELKEMPVENPVDDPDLSKAVKKVREKKIVS